MARFCTVVAILIMAGLFYSPARAQTRINVETTAGSAGAALFAAKGEGFFDSAGSTSISSSTSMPNFPPALVAGSADVGFMVATTFLQAVEGGLDLVAFAGGSATSHTLSPEASSPTNGTNSTPRRISSAERSAFPVSARRCR